MLQASEQHYRRQQALSAAALVAARKAWRQVSLEDLDTSWGAVLRRFLQTLVGVQVAAARDAERYTVEALEEQDLDPEPVAELVPESFSGVASDGRPLGTLLQGPVYTTKQRIGQGWDGAQALDSGQAALETVVLTQVQDASRAASGVGIAARPQVSGYVRMLNPPSCSRCAILAGRWYRWSAGFQRHPRRCDCRHIPAGEDAAGDLTTDPKRYFDSLPQAEQDRVFTKAGARAIRDGADLTQVVNARRGMYTASGRRFTREGVTRRRGRARLMPEEIYREAGDNREEAIRLLRLHGYLI